MSICSARGPLADVGLDAMLPLSMLLVMPFCPSQSNVQSSIAYARRVSLLFHVALFRSRGLVYRVSYLRRSAVAVPGFLL